MIIYRNKHTWLKQNCKGSDTTYLFLRFSVYHQIKSLSGIQVYFYIETARAAAMNLYKLFLPIFKLIAIYAYSADSGHSIRRIAAGCFD